MPRRTTTQALLTLVAALAIFAFQYATRHGNAPAPTQSPVARAPDSPSAQAPESPGARPNVGFRSRQALEEHFRKHGREFGPGVTIDEYLRRAQTLRDAPAGGAVLSVTRSDGVITRFDRGTGDFVAVNPDGTIRTFFRPNDGEAYFRRQAQRSTD